MLPLTKTPPRAPNADLFSFGFFPMTAVAPPKARFVIPRIEFAQPQSSAQLKWIFAL